MGGNYGPYRPDLLGVGAELFVLLLILAVHYQSDAAVGCCGGFHSDLNVIALIGIKAVISRGDIIGNESLGVEVSAFLVINEKGRAVFILYYGSRLLCGGIVFCGSFGLFRSLSLFGSFGLGRGLFLIGLLCFLCGSSFFGLLSGGLSDLSGDLLLGRS